MDGINRALKNESFTQTINKAIRILESTKDSDVPCVFISYQRKDENYAKEVSEYIMSKQIDVYFDLEDNDLKLHMQNENPKRVTQAIQKALNKSDYMIVIVSPDTYLSPWVPFEVGYAYDNKGKKMKLLRHKGINKITLPSYLQVKEMLNGTISLNSFLEKIRKSKSIYETLINKGEEVKALSEFNSNPLKQYLDNE